MIPFKENWSIKRIDLVLLFVLIIISTSIYTFVGFMKHNQFQTFGWDTSVFIQQLYFISNFKPPYSLLHQMNGLGDHFQVFFLMLGGPLYWIFPHQITLFFLQAFIASLSALPLYLLTKYLLSETKLEERLIIILSLALSILYLFSVSFQAMMTDEFHNEPLVTLPTIFMIYFLITKNQLGYWISFGLFLLTKETFSLLSIPLGIYILMLTKEYKKAILTMIIGSLTFYLLIFQLMPYLSNSQNYYHFRKGNSPSYIINKLINDPVLLITDFINNPKKVQTIGSSLISFGFLPLLSPTNLVMPISSLAIRFYDDSSERLYEFNNHYSAPYISFLAIAACFGLFNLVKFLENKKINVNKSWILFLGVLVSFSLFQDIYFHAPLNSLAKRNFYEILPWQSNAHELIKQVPQVTPVASQNSLLPHLSQRDEFYLLPNIGNANYIAVDLSDGPNKFAPVHKEEISKLINQLIDKEKFSVIWRKGEAILLKRN